MFGEFNVISPTPGAGLGALPSMTATPVPIPVPTFSPRLPTTLVATMPAPTTRFMLTRLPRINLLLGYVVRRTTLPLPIPPQLQAPVTTKIAMFAPGTPLPGGTPQIGLEQVEGLWVVSIAAQPVIQAVMSSMTYKGQSMTNNEASGQAMFVIGPSPAITAWQTVNDMIGAGYAAMVEKASVTTGTLNLLFTKDPGTVATKSGGDTATHALISADEPQNVLQPALAQLHGGAVPGSVVEGEKAPGEKPAWLVPVLLGAGVLAIGFLIFGKRTAKANPKRRRRYKKICTCEKFAINPPRSKFESLTTHEIRTMLRVGGKGRKGWKTEARRELRRRGLRA